MDPRLIDYEPTEDNDIPLGLKKSDSYRRMKEMDDVRGADGNEGILGLHNQQFDWNNPVPIKPESSAANPFSLGFNNPMTLPNYRSNLIKQHTLPTLADFQRDYDQQLQVGSRSFDYILEDFPNLRKEQQPPRPINFDRPQLSPYNDPNGDSRYSILQQKFANANVLWSKNDPQIYQHL